ncbi:glycosyltransferase family 2 protein [Frigoribacterium sp. VKM Ac-2836]|uniref:glycosyltransferase family 2 protein n=1 Tax=Frigoribacterium sp. VKM Ac-2836 TaxID=2739014 RepID=UPI001567AE6A|nr:glycosyltransferase family 2 protein [Frigoribacterium sp. VKM Ac-2836]NRD25420.1 glycosyltransferase family 2 protein [Frigoribacterium sp. VKM Ac-2836]
MFRGAVVAAVVPAYKEESMIERVIETMPDYVDHIVIVDDCSPDRTSEVVRASSDPRVDLIRHEVNQGVGGAIITGHTRAMDLGADVNVIMAGDAQMDPAFLPDLLDRVTDGGYGFAKANRFFSPESFEGMPRYRVLGNIGLSFMTKLASGYWHLFDPQNGYTAIRTSVLRRLPLQNVARRYSFENDLLIHLNILQVPAVDVPIPAVYGDEVSSIKLSKVVPELVNLLGKGFLRRIWYRYVLWSFSPIALLLVLGVVLFGFGVAISIWIVFLSVTSVIATAATVMLAALPLMIGTQLLISALQLDIQASPDTPDAHPFGPQEDLA